MSTAAADTPQRIQRKRARGWRMPEGAVYVGRPSRWGNPFATAAEFDHWAHHSTAGREIADHAVQHLGGRSLACWCPPSKECHADVLLRLANAFRTGVQS